jgi:hypothetical protein
VVGTFASGANEIRRAPAKYYGKRGANDGGATANEILPAFCGRPRRERKRKADTRQVTLIVRRST